MIEITVELIDSRTFERSHLGTAHIVNDGSGDIDRGNYDIMLSKWGQPTVSWKKGRVEDFPRRIRGPWDLLYLALRNVVGDRNR